MKKKMKKNTENNVKKVVKEILVEGHDVVVEKLDPEHALEVDYLKISKSSDDSGFDDHL